MELTYGNNQGFLRSTRQAMYFADTARAVDSTLVRATCVHHFGRAADASAGVRSKHHGLVDGRWMNDEDTAVAHPIVPPAAATSEAPGWGRGFWLAVAVTAFIGLLGGVSWAKAGDAGYDSTGTVFVALAFSPEERDPFSGSQFVTQQLGQAPWQAQGLHEVAHHVGGGERTLAHQTGDKRLAIDAIAAVPLEGGV